ncbi:N-acetylmuramoyl-L-alanine amidase [Clostridium thermobutyricum]|uniref:N-acetylmuramoyl-L-alanine amidase AmiC n=1 Tax=Clostridium thermobutyricum DSM 4928 TaxID=1121339 RepID=A0A1V4SSB6_9CLOT|nr:N-acetylmuramoyl-L-alanine amidase [Clostridium thermobutyricum]OPX46769.1 N-acetylmuramoyl-L-alanine amidase AmiC precursor [Clostridium thermobutyricum DSM 4928]
MNNFKGKIFILVLTISLALGIKVFANEINFEKNEDTNLQKVILIDPGHGGSDGGARSNSGVQEKDINLQISLKLKKKLEERGYKSFLTRESDMELAPKKKDDLELRCKKKDEVKSDVFISIHQNKFGQESCWGSQIWHASNDKSKLLAEKIQSSIKENLQNKNERVPKDAKKAFKILRDGNKEANIILECGFISNYKEEKNLQNQDYQNKLVEAIIKGIDEYFKVSK